MAVVVVVGGGVTSGATTGSVGTRASTAAAKAEGGGNSSRQRRRAAARSCCQAQAHDRTDLHHEQRAEGDGALAVVVHPAGVGPVGHVEQALAAWRDAQERGGGERSRRGVVMWRGDIGQRGVGQAERRRGPAGQELHSAGHSAAHGQL